MIEFCSKKRMLIACGLLVSISFVVLLIENNLKMGRTEMKDVPEEQDNIETPCWAEQKIEVVEECHKCSDFERKLHDYCVRTGFKEKVKCLFENGTEKEMYKSCPRLTHIEERAFWSFEGTIVLLGLVSYGVVHLRQSKLNRELMERVHKQIAAGV